MWRSCVSWGLREAKAAAASLLLLAAAAARSSSEVPDAAGEGFDQEAAVRMVPMAQAGAGFSAVVLNETRRRLGSFQLCAPYTCGGGPRGVCVLSPCCHAINCLRRRRRRRAARHLPPLAGEKVVFTELCNMLDPGKPAFIPKKGKPSVVMFVGLQVSAMGKEKIHINIVVIGHVDSGSR